MTLPGMRDGKKKEKKRDGVNIRIDGYHAVLLPNAGRRKGIDRAS
jgi:hypothetical protein